MLVALVILAFLAAALGLFGVPGLAIVWRAAAVGGAALSFVTITLLWHPWFVVGLALDVAIVVVVAPLHWPPAG